MRNSLRSPVGWLGIALISGIALLPTVNSVEAGSDSGSAPIKPSEPIARKPTGDEDLRPDENTMPEDSALEDLRKRREEVDARDAALKVREEEFKAREQALSEELKKIEAVRDEIGKIDEGRRKENEEKVAKLVATFETMSPKSAAQVFATLDDALAIAAMAKMATPKLAKILNVMEPSRSSKLTELMAGVVRARHPASSNGGAATTNQMKGGEKKYDVNQE